MKDSYHTKIIATILEPISQQISNLIVLYESSSDGRCLLDLRGPVAAVDEAVQRLIQVGQDTAASSNDQRLNKQLTASLQRVPQSSRLLKEAAEMFVRDPSSAEAKLKLVEGSRGILQGTHEILLAWDESEVRKIVVNCRLLIDRLQPVCGMETEEHLVHFIQEDLNVLLPRVNQAVLGRANELLDEEERDFLVGEIDRLPALIEELLSELKLRLILLLTKSNAIKEVTDNIALTVDKITALLLDVIDMLLYHAIASDRQRLLRLLKQGLQQVRAVANGDDPSGTDSADLSDFGAQLRDCLVECGWLDRPGIDQLHQELVSTMDSLCHSVRDRLPDQTESLLAQVERQVLALAVECGDKSRLIGHGAPDLQHPGSSFRPPHQQQQDQQQQQHYRSHRRATIEEAIAALQRQPFNLEAAATACLEAAQPATQANHPHAQELAASSAALARRLLAMSNAPAGELESARARLLDQMTELSSLLGPDGVRAACDAFLDPMGPIKRLVDCAERGETDAFYSAADSVRKQAGQLSEAAELVALKPPGHLSAADSARERGTRQSAVRSVTDQLNRLAPQLANAGRARLLVHSGGSPGPAASGVADHLRQLQDAWREAVDRLRNRLDRLADLPACLRQLLADVTADSEAAAAALQASKSAAGARSPSQQQFVAATSAAARRANRAVQLLQADAENCLDSAAKADLVRQAAQLRDAIGAMVTAAKAAASDPAARGPAWRDANQQILDLLGDLLLTRYKPSERRFSSSSSEAPSSAMSPQLRQPQPQWSSSGGSKSPSRSLGFDPPQQQPQPQPPPPPPKPQPQPPPPPPKPQPQQKSPTRRVSNPTGETDDLDADDYAQIDRVEHRLPPPSSTPATLTAPGQQQQQRPPASAQKPQQSVSFGLVPTEQLNERLFDQIEQSQASQPILEAARSLHQQVTQYSSEDNEIIAAAEKISLLFARLNQIMNEKDSSKKDLLDTAKAIVEASQNVTRIGNSLASRCTDLSIQGSLLRSCQKIPTIGTQLKILTAVKATTMLGDPEEDMEATDMLVGNARALMDAVSQTVQVAEGASIKIRVDAGAVMKWRKRTK
ncbi:hypothetical protein BOX15_Mlig002790g1 [Macrostomum lignano]|uniref:Vinculin n=1 Tax=Macrostomum lignano TaxID=282301 RepID=A0A267GI30_9PLAT|nr:hypothetical protein BOX15_Mlig002790g1 [Macrostomum lignano]